MIVYKGSRKKDDHGVVNSLEIKNDQIRWSEDSALSFNYLWIYEYLFSLEIIHLSTETNWGCS